MSVDGWFRGTGPIEDRSMVIVCFVHRKPVKCGSLLQEANTFGLRDVKLCDPEFRNLYLLPELLYLVGVGS